MQTNGSRDPDSDETKGELGQVAEGGTDDEKHEHEENLVVKSALEFGLCHGTRSAICREVTNLFAEDYIHQG